MERLHGPNYLITLLVAKCELLLADLANRAIVVSNERSILLEVRTTVDYIFKCDTLLNL